MREGELGARDAIRILPTPSHGMTVGDVFRIYRDEIAKLVDIPELSES